MDVTSLSLPDESGTPSRPIRPAPDPAAGQVFADNVDETGEIEPAPGAEAAESPEIAAEAAESDAEDGDEATDGDVAQTQVDVLQRMIEAWSGITSEIAPAARPQDRAAAETAISGTAPIVQNIVSDDRVGTNGEAMITADIPDEALPEFGPDRPRSGNTQPPSAASATIPRADSELTGGGDRTDEIQTESEGDGANRQGETARGTEGRIAETRLSADGSGLSADGSGLSADGSGGNGQAASPLAQDRAAVPGPFSTDPAMLRLSDPGLISIDFSDAPGQKPQLPRHDPGAAIRQIADAVVRQRDDRIEIALSPEELGRVRMTLSGRDHAPHVVIWAERPEVMDMLRRNATMLIEQFIDVGVEDATLEFDHRGSGEQDRNPAGQNLPDFGDGPTGLVMQTAIATSAGPWMSGLGRLDIRL